jgi:glutamyl-tRNA synthetase
VRKHHGTMVLRIDDTDVDRNTEESLNSIYEELDCLGLNWDESYRQSEHLDGHRRLAYDLLGAIHRLRRV